MCNVCLAIERLLLALEYLCNKDWDRDFHDSNGVDE